MPNQVLGNVYVLTDKEQYLTTGSTATGSFMNMSVSAVALYAADSTGDLALSFASANSTDIVRLRVVEPAGGTASISFTDPLKVSERLYVRLLTAGTGYIYFS